MDIERRKYLRFLSPLIVEAVKEDNTVILGITKDFSREGLCVVFDHFDQVNPDSPVTFRVQKPNENSFVPITADLVWKRAIDEKCMIGVKFRDFPSAEKAEFLEYGYRNWLKERGLIQ